MECPLGIESYMDKGAAYVVARARFPYDSRTLEPATPLLMPRDGAKTTHSNVDSSGYGVSNLLVRRGGSIYCTFYDRYH